MGRKGRRVRGAGALLLLLAALPALLLAGCGARNLSDTVDSVGAGRVMELRYADQFSVTTDPDGRSLITIGGTDRYLYLPPGTEAPADPDPAVTVLRGPLDRVYLAASSAMDFYRALGTLGDVRLTGTRAADWTLPEVVDALDEGRMLYAGKYSAPDYELLLDEGADIAIESTMIWHSPEVRETLTALGIPVLVERSSYEESPLGRLEWVKLYGLLCGREAEAAAFFDEQVRALSSLRPAATEKTVAFFSISAAGYAVVRRPGDYISRMIGMAGGTYIPADLPGAEDSARSTINMEAESFCAAAREADIIIYNSAIGDDILTLEELISQAPLLADFTAVEDGNVWCTGKNLFQRPTAVADLVLELGRILSGEEPGEMRYFHRVTAAEGGSPAP